MVKQKKSFYQNLDMPSILDIWSRSIAEALVILMACIQPLYLDSTLYLRLTQAKYKFFVFCAGMSVITALVVCLLRLLTRDQSREWKMFRLRFFDWAVISFAFVTVLSAVLSPFANDMSVWIGRSERYDGALVQLLYIAIFFIISRWYVPRTRDFIFFGITATIVGLIGILQFYGLDIFGLWPNDMPNFHVENFYNIHFRSTLGNVDILSAYVCIAVTLCGFLFIGANSRWKFLWFMASVLNFWLMDIAGADSGRAGTLAAVLISIPFVIEHRRYLGKFLLLTASWIFVYLLQKLLYDVNILKTMTLYSLAPFILASAGAAMTGAIILKFSVQPVFGRPVYWKWGVFLVTLIVVLGLAGVELIGSRIEDTGNLIYQVREIMHGRMRDEFGTYRGYVWRIALENFAYPILGTGPDTFIFAFPSEAQEVFGQIYERAHNEYLQILMCQGVLGIVTYLAFLGSVFFKSVINAFKNPVIMAVLLAFVGYCAQAFFNISAPIVSQILWVLAGILACKWDNFPTVVL